MIMLFVQLWHLRNGQHDAHKGEFLGAWDAKVKDLERRYREEENSEIHEMVHAANLNPEQLSELLRMFAADMAPKPDTINTMNEEETQNEI